MDAVINWQGGESMHQKKHEEQYTQKHGSFKAMNTFPILLFRKYYQSAEEA